MFHEQNLVLTSAGKEKTGMDVIQSTDQSEEEHNTWQRYMSTHEGSDNQEYAKTRNQARNETRKALRDYEKDIAKKHQNQSYIFLDMWQVN